MRVNVGGGWVLWHITDRVVVLRKECAIYRKITGQDGYVMQTVEPGMTRDEAYREAIKTARENDRHVERLVKMEWERHKVLGDYREPSYADLQTWVREFRTVPESH